MTDLIVREFTVAVFAVHCGRILLLRHPKLGRWLAPGGHIELNELPDEAAVREVEEETGVQVRLVGGQGVPVHEPRQLVRPAGIQLENIAPGHQHIDLVYFAVPREGAQSVSLDCARAVGANWFDAEQLTALDLDDEILAWCDRALTEIPGLETSSELPETPATAILSE